MIRSLAVLVAVVGVSPAWANVINADDRRKTATEFSSERDEKLLTSAKASTTRCLRGLAGELKGMEIAVVGDGQLAITSDDKPLRILSKNDRTTEIESSGNCRTVSSAEDQGYRAVLAKAFAALKAAKLRPEKQCRINGLASECDSEPGQSGAPLKPNVREDSPTLAACRNSHVPYLRDLASMPSGDAPFEVGRPTGGAR